MLSTKMNELVTIAQNKNTLLNGSDAYFVRLDGRWGYKFFTRKRVRDETYRLQKRFARKGLAPKILMKLDHRQGKTKYYGYITEAVVYTMDEMKHEIYSMFRDCNLSPNNQSYWEFVDSVCIRSNKLTNELLARIEKHFSRDEVRACDYHDGNVGFMPNGDVVMIDFSRFQTPHNGDMACVAFQ